MGYTGQGSGMSERMCVGPGTPPRMWDLFDTIKYV